MRNGVITLFVLASCGCGYSLGEIVERRSTPSFVKERAWFYGNSARGIERVPLDGTEPMLVFARVGTGGLAVLDVSFDQRTFLIGDSDTNLFVGDVSSRTMRRVGAVDRRSSTASFSPDGQRFAVARHSDFSLPQGSQQEDDTLFLVETSTLAVTELPASSQSWPARIVWAQDQSGLYVTMNWEGKPQWVSLPDRVRHLDIKDPPAALSSRRDPQPRCALTPLTSRWGTTIRLVPTAMTGEKRLELPQQQDLDRLPGATVVTLVGRKRGFHDYQPDFHELSMTPGCGYVVFGFDHHVLIADAKGGAAAPIYAGGFLFWANPRAEAR